MASERGTKPARRTWRWLWGRLIGYPPFFFAIYVLMYFATVEPGAAPIPEGAVMVDVCDVPCFGPEGGWLFDAVYWMDRTLIRRELWKDACD